MSGENLRLSILIEAQAEQARREMVATARATRDLRGAAEEAGRGADGLSQAMGGIATPLRGAQTAADGLRAAVAGLRPEMAGQVDGFLAAASAGAAWEAELTAIRAELNPAVAAHQQLTAAIDQVETAEALGAITAREATLAHDQLSRSLTALEAKAAELGISLTRIGPPAQQATSALQQMIDRQTGVSAATDRSTAATLAHGRMLDDLRAKYNPLFAASQRYEQELRDIAEAERLTAITANEAAAARTRAAAAMAPMTQGVIAFGQANGAAAAYTANLGYQVNDIAVMLAAGQNPFMLMMQQGTQVVQVFQQMQASGMSVGGAIRTSLMGLVSPMSLATMGVIGLGAVAVKWFMATRDSTVSAKEALESLAGNVGTLVRSNADARQSLADLREEFGGNAVAARELLVVMRDIQRLRAADALDAAVKAIRGEFSGLSTEIREMVEAIDAGATGGTGLARSRAINATEDLQAAFKLSADQARELLQAMDALGSASGPKEVAAQAYELNQLLHSIYGSTANIPPELRNLAEEVAKGNLEALKLLRATDQMPAGIDAATAAARRLTDEIVRAVAAADGLSVGSVEALEDARTRNRFAGDPIGEARALAETRARRVQAPLRIGADAAERDLLDGYVRDEGRRAAEIARLDADTRARSAKTSGRGGGHRRGERDDVAELISGLRSELDILRELDPVQQEMIRHREALAGATDGERAMVEELIRTRNAEAEALERVKAQMEDVRSLGHDVVRGLISDLRNGASAADIFANVLDRIADKLLDMGATGIADVLFGAKGSSGGGLLGGFLGSILGIKMNALGDVVGAPTLFAYGDKPGQLGMMGEAGPEAIMPLTHSMGAGVGAIMDGQETVLSLTRLASGKLGVEVPTPFALGGAFGTHIPAPPMRPTRADHARTQGASGGIGGQARLSIALSPGLTAKLEGQMEGIAIRVVGAYGEELDRNLPARLEAISNDPGYRG